LVSAAVSLTLTPMMCARLLSATGHGGQRARKADGGRLLRLTEGVLERVLAGYRRSLEWVLGHERLTLAVTAMTVIVTIWLYAVAPKGFLPLQDTGLISAVLEANPDVSFEEMKRRQAVVAAEISADPAVSGVVSVIGVSPLNPTPNAGRLAVTLKPRGERQATISEIVARLKQRLDRLPDAIVYLQPVQDVQISTQSSRALYQYTLVGADQREVSRWSTLLKNELAASPLLRDVASEAQEGGLKAMVNVDRAAAGRLGVSMQAVSDTLNNAFGQRQISTIYGQANQYRVVLEAAPRYQTDPGALAQIHVASSTGQQIPLGAIARIERQTAPLVVQRQEQFPAATLSFNPAPGTSLGEAVAVVTEAQRRIGMPTSVSGSFVGDAAEFQRSLASQPWLILAAVIAIYIVLGVLYESVAHPFTILTTLPSAGIGAVLALMLVGLDLSLVALIGIILLMGIVKKNAIMMIDFALEAERKGGMTPREAIMQACMLRFRPIMMTTLAALLGALPLAVSHGTGSELRVPLGITIIGGLLLSQLLTLYTTPVIYLTLDRIGAGIKHWWGRVGGAPTTPPHAETEARPTLSSAAE
jgi:multidrug efflux pump